jgi:hypothetical protein
VASAAVVAVQAPSSATTAGSLTAHWKVVSLCRPAHGNRLGCFAMQLVRTDHSGLSTAAAARQRLGVSRADGVTFGEAGGYTPADLASAYGVNPDAAASSGITVAIVDAYGDTSITSDLNAFNTKYGLPAETASSFKVLNQSGGTTLPAGPPGTDPNWPIEEALDTQAVRGLCHKCKIVLIQANSPSFTDLATAEDTAVNTIHADVVSNSFGGPESASTPASFQSAFDHPKTAILASTGDDGWYSWDQFNKGNASAGKANTPSGFNTVIAVGGTSLYLNPSGSRAGEQVWNDNGPSDTYGFGLGAALGAAGGGCSQVFTPQKWQKSVTGYASLGCGSMRSGTDIAAVADPHTGYDIHDAQVLHGWGTIGGTSLASPVVAALYALAGGPGGVKYPALTLYGHFKSAPASYDITIGGTGLCGTDSTVTCKLNAGGNPNQLGSAGLLDCAFPASGSGTIANDAQCYARPGYDGVSGVGAPKGIKLFQPMKPTAKIASPGTVTHGHSKTFDGSTSSDPFPGGTISTYSWDFGDGHTGTGTTLAHTFATKGTFTVTLTVTDNYGLKGKITRSVPVK